MEVRVVVPFQTSAGFREVPYTSLLTLVDHRGLAGTLSLSAGGNDRKKCYGDTPLRLLAVREIGGRGGVVPFMPMRALPILVLLKFAEAAVRDICRRTYV